MEALPPLALDEMCFPDAYLFSSETVLVYAFDKTHLLFQFPCFFFMEFNSCTIMRFVVLPRNKIGGGILYNKFFTATNSINQTLIFNICRHSYLPLFTIYTVTLSKYILIDSNIQFNFTWMILLLPLSLFICSIWLYIVCMMRFKVWIINSTRVKPLKIYIVPNLTNLIIWLNYYFL